jgi:hypothetical protein
MGSSRLFTPRNHWPSRTAAPKRLAWNERGSARGSLRPGKVRRVKETFSWRSVLAELLTAAVHALRKRFASGFNVHLRSTPLISTIAMRAREVERKGRFVARRPASPAVKRAPLLTVRAASDCAARSKKCTAHVAVSGNHPNKNQTRKIHKRRHILISQRAATVKIVSPSSQRQFRAPREPPFRDRPRPESGSAHRPRSGLSIPSRLASSRRKRAGRGKKAPRSCALSGPGTTASRPLLHTCKRP